MNIIFSPGPIFPYHFQLGPKFFPYGPGCTLFNMRPRINFERLFEGRWPFPSSNGDLLLAGREKQGVVSQVVALATIYGAVSNLIDLYFVVMSPRLRFVFSYAFLLVIVVSNIRFHTSFFPFFSSLLFILIFKKASSPFLRFF